MIETASTTQQQAAFARAHTERAEAFAALRRSVTAILVRPFRALAWPQVGARRLPVPPQACPAGQ